MPNVEFFAPWFRSGALIRSMSYETWQTLSPHAQRLSRYIVGAPGEPIVGEGINHPRRAERERIRTEQFDAMTPGAATAYRRLSE